MHVFACSAAVLVAVLVTCDIVATAPDFDVQLQGHSAGSFEFIYHDLHDLLLTIHDGSCYFAFYEERLHSNHYLRTKMENDVINVITNDTYGHGRKHISTLGDVMDLFEDRLADFHCLNSDVYILYIDVLSCDFEDAQSTLCGWKSSTGNGVSLEWTPHHGHTPTVLTGPLADHTKETDQGVYLYMEANLGNSGEIAEIASPEVHANDGLCLRFWYNMYGANVGTLAVIARKIHYVSNITLWSLTGNQGHGWWRAEATVPPNYAGRIDILIQAVHGDGIAGDIAIDDISSMIGICVPDYFSCSFEHTLCHWSNVEGQADDYEWLRHRGSTPTLHTGPVHADPATHAHNVYYVYAGAEGHSRNQKAVLQSELVTLGEPMCLIFHYHMNGTGVGELDVILRKWTGLVPEDTVLWRMAGSQGEKWNEARVTVHHTDRHTQFQVLFQAVTGPSEFGDIAIDTIKGVAGSCDHYASSAHLSTIGVIG